MNNEKYLNLLGLRENFTEEELKQAYRRVAKKWHPDFYQGKSEEEIKYAKEKMTEINIAYDYLSKHKGTRKYSSNQTSNRTSRNNTSNDNDLSEINRYAKEKYEDIKAYLNLTISDDMPISIQKAYIILKSLLDGVAFNFHCNSNTKKNIDKWYELYMKKIGDIYTGLVRDYGNEYRIAPVYMKGLNYGLGLKEFYGELENIRKNYGIEVIFEKKVYEETEKYKQYAGYEKLDRGINEIIQRTVKNAKDCNYHDIDIILKDMHDRILYYFDRYYQISKNIYDMEDEIKVINIDEINKSYYLLKEALSGDDPMGYLETNYIKFTELINKYKREQNKTMVNELFNGIINKFNQLLSNLDINNDMEKIEKLYDSLGKIITIFKEYNLGHVSFRELQKIAEINFEDDINIINYAGSNDSEDNVDNDNSINDIDNYEIYLHKKDTSVPENTNFYVIDKRDSNNIYVISSDLKVIEIDYTYHQEALKKLVYISLDKVLNYARLVGHKFLDSEKYLIYNWDDEDYARYNIFVEDGNFSVSASDRNYFELLSIYEDESIIDKYGDKEKVKQMIKQQLIKTLKQNIDKNTGDIKSDSNSKTIKIKNKKR